MHSNVFLFISQYIFTHKSITQPFNPTATLPQSFPPSPQHVGVALSRQHKTSASGTHLFRACVKSAPPRKCANVNSAGARASQPQPIQEREENPKYQLHVQYNHHRLHHQQPESRRHAWRRGRWKFAHIWGISQICERLCCGYASGLGLCCANIYERACVM